MMEESLIYIYSYIRILKRKRVFGK